MNVSEPADLRDPDFPRGRAARGLPANRAAARRVQPGAARDPDRGRVRDRFAAAAAFAATTEKRGRARRCACAGAAAVGLPRSTRWRLEGPAIHDISTDLQDRIEFTPTWPHLDEQGPGARGARRRRVLPEERLPELAPIQLALPPDQAFARAKRSPRRCPAGRSPTPTARAPDRGDRHLAALPLRGRHRDPRATRRRGSRVDLRSRSRVGQSDLGANARASAPTPARSPSRAEDAARTEASAALHRSWRPCRRRCGADLLAADVEGRGAAHVRALPELHLGVDALVVLGLFFSRSRLKRATSRPACLA